MNKNLKKAITAISALAMTASSFVAVSADYTDVTADNQYASAINQLSAMGIVDGFEDGTFKPEENVNRAQFAKLVVGAMNKLAQAEANSTQIFTDVAPGSYDWAIGYVAQAYQDGLVNGTNDENTTYDPAMNVTYAQAMKMLVCAAGYDQWSLNAGGWPNGYLSYANQVGIGNGVTGVSNDTALTRGQCAQMIANTLTAAICKPDGYTVDNGVQVANLKQMDGSDNKVFQSLLTQNWNAYEVNGAVTGTHEMGTTEVGKVNYKIMRTKNYDDSEYGDNGKNALPVEINDMYVGSTNASETLNQYTKAIVSIDESTDDATIMYIELAGKNVEVEFDANNYDSISGGKISIYKSASSSSTTEYKLADGSTHGEEAAKMLVNGVEVDLDAANAKKYLKDNADVKAVLIDTPANTTGNSVSTDGYYDYVVVDYALPAVVDEVTTKSDSYKVNFDTYAAGLGKGYLEVDPEDDTKTYTFVKDGNEIDVTELQQNDVLSIKWDVRSNKNINESDFVKVEVVNNVVSGNCTATGKDSDGKDYYTVNNTKYYMSAALDGDSLNVSYTYDLYLDANGDVAKYVQNAASVNLAIVDRTFTSAGDNKVRLILKDGSKVDYTLKSGAGINDTINTKSGSKKTDTEWALEERIVEYSVNSSNEVTIKKVAETDRQGLDKFEKATSYVGSYKMTDSSIILDASDFATDGTSSVSVASVSSFADQMEYGIIVAGDRNTSDNTYPFIVIYQGDNGYNVDTQMAIFQNYGTAQDDGYDVNEMFVFVDGADEATPVLCETTVELDKLTEGDAIVYKKNSDGYVDQVVPVTAQSTSAIANNNGQDVLDKVNETATKYPYNNGAMISSAVKALTFNGDGDVSFVFAPVIDKNSAGVTVALKLTKQDVTMKGAENPVNVYASGIAGKTFSYAADVKAYAYDGNARDNFKLEAIGASGVVKSSIVNAGKDTNGTIINWESADNSVAYALLRLVDNQVQEILSISTVN